MRHSSPGTLLDIIQQARSRWRMKLALRGVVRVVAIAFLLVLIAAYGLDWARFTATSILVARIGLFAALFAAVAWFLVRPLRRKVSDEQVALYLEEHEPTLQATLLSAVEASQHGRPESAALVQRVIEQALEKCAEIDASRRVERMPLRRNGVALAAVALVAIAVVTLGPAFIRNAVSALLLVQRDVEAAVPYRIQVKPGNATVPKGADQTIVATLQGFEGKDVVVMGKRAPTSAFEPIPLSRNEDGTFEGILFDVAAPLEYFVLAEGVQSEHYTLRVVDLPYVQQLNLEYRFPAYTGLEPQKVEDGGDIAVLRGTEVHVQITPTMKTTGGRLLVNDKSTLELALQKDGTLTASFKADTDGFYRVELNAPNGDKVPASPQYTIDVLADGAPSVSFKRPGRDTSVSPIEEVFVEANADDDYGVRNLELVYSVNGGPEKVVKLFDGAGKRLPEVTASHTFYLEELGVQPGDAVSYYARAVDNDAISGAKDASSDIYFLRIRPLNKNFRQAQSAGGGGGGGGGGGNQQIEALSEQQKQIISATHNVQRDRKKMAADKLRQSTNVVSLSQSKLREQVEGLLTRMNSQLVQQDPAFKKIAEMLPQAVTAMKEAETKLNAVTPDQALAPENRALRILQTAEEEYEVQVSAQRQQGGGGGGGGGQQQRDLADLFEQDLDKLASRYETANQQSQEQGERQVDELLEKLKELARRQEQEAERQRRRALEGQSGGGNSGAQQRALADQVEEEARRLERLAREEQRQDLADVARQMQDAANAMRRAAAGGDATAQAQAQAALDKIRESQQRLQRGLTDRTKGDIDEAKRAADQAAQQQQEIADATKQLATADSGLRQRQARQLSDKEDQLRSRLGDLEQQLARAARDASKDEKQAARKLTEAADAIRGNQLGERVRLAGNMINYGRSSGQALASAQNDITRGIDEVRKRLDEADAALGQGGNAKGDARQQALDRARALARGAESMAERTRERGQQGQQGQQDQQGQQAQNGQRGQQGQQGQQGQGQQGQQGQGQQGQGGQRGQQGQQGQGGQGQQAQNGQQGGQGGGGGRNNDGGNVDGRVGEYAGGGTDRNGYRGDQVGWGGWWNGQPINLSDEDIRQLSREARQYADDLNRLRSDLRNQDLKGAEIDPKQLDQMMSALRDLADPRVYKNVAELARLQAYVAEQAKRVDFALRREVEAQNAVSISGSDEVPDAFREEVAEYYRSLAKTPQK